MKKYVRTVFRELRKVAFLVCLGAAFGYAIGLGFLLAWHQVQPRIELVVTAGREA